MTRDEFATLMDEDGWSEVQRAGWKKMRPLCDPATFRREMGRPDGVIEFERENGSLVRAMWRRLFLKRDLERKQPPACDFESTRETIEGDD